MSTPPSAMIVTPDARLMNASVSSATGMPTKYASIKISAARIIQPIGSRLRDGRWPFLSWSFTAVASGTCSVFSSVISVPRPGALGWELAAYEVIDVDRDVQRAVQHDHGCRDRHRRHDVGVVDLEDAEHVQALESGD